MDTQSERWQQMDQEQAFMRSLELVQKAQASKLFTDTDIEDLMYFLGLKELI